MSAQKNEGTSASTGTQGGRRPTGGPVDAGTVPDPQVSARITRRRFTIAYKLRVLETIDSLRENGNGAVGAYLRKEGLYFSSVSTWQRQREQGLLTATRRGPREKSREALLREVKQLRRKLERTEKKLAKTEMIVDLQKKLSAFMETNTEPGTNDAG